MLLASGQSDVIKSENFEIADVDDDVVEDNVAVMVGVDEADVAVNASTSSESDADILGFLFASYPGGESSYSVSSDCDRCVDDNDKPSLDVALAQWVTRYNIPQMAVSGLLSILKPYHPSLPADPRTLLKTPQNYQFKEIVGSDGQIGHYYHFGIAAGIVDLLPQTFCISCNRVVLVHVYSRLCV